MRPVFRRLASPWVVVVAGVVAGVGACTAAVPAPSESSLERLPSPEAADGPAAGDPQSESPTELGRFEIWGHSARTVAHAAGEFGARYRYGSTKFPTMERRHSTTIVGQASLGLLEDGRVEACLGMRSTRTRSVSRHASPDRKHHSEEKREARVLAGAGRWTDQGEKIRIELSNTWWDDCERPVEPSGAGSMTLECVRLTPDDFIPMPMLACSLGTQPVNFVAETLAINPADTPRAGPYTLQSVARSPEPIDEGEPWLLLGLGRTLVVDSIDGKGTEPPQVALEVESPALPFRREDYQPTGD